MIDDAANDALDALSSCQCCLLGGAQRSLKIPYIHQRKTEIYSDMLKECFDIRLNVGSEKSGICLACVARLRDASRFKQQVQHSQLELRRRLTRALGLLEEEAPALVKPEPAAAWDGAPDGEAAVEVPDTAPDVVECVEHVKPERAGEEGRGEEGRGEEAGQCRLHHDISTLHYDRNNVDTSRRAYNVGKPEPAGVLGAALVVDISDDDARHEHDTAPAAATHDEQAVTVKSERSDDAASDDDDGMSYEDRAVKSEQSEQSDDAASNDDATIDDNAGSDVNATIDDDNATIGDDAASDDDDDDVSPVWSERESARARRQLAMTCAVRLERLRIHTHTHTPPPRGGNSGEHTERKRFKCEICHKSFMNLKTHLLIHRQKPFKCQICNKGFRRHTALKEHITIHTGEKPYSCNICNKQFRYRNSFTEHIKIHASQEHMALQCGICTKQFAEIRYLTEHMRRHLSKEFNARSMLEEHSKVDTSREQNSLHIQDTKGDLKIPIGTEDKRVNCEICHKSFSQKYMLKGHMPLHTRLFKCEICNKRFNRKDTLKEHVTIHTGEKPFSCHLCSKQFRFRTSFTKHFKYVHTNQKRMTTHTGRPFKCDICNKRFGLRCTLISHKNHVHTSQEYVSLHPERKPFKCEICNKQFAVKRYLTEHIDRHLKKQMKVQSMAAERSEMDTSQEHVSPHAVQDTRGDLIGAGNNHVNCGICNKSFSDKNLVKRHMLIHTGQKPFKCKLCNMGFKHYTSLREHVIRHAGEKPYSCEICNKRFAVKRYLTTHISRHSSNAREHFKRQISAGGKRVNCGICRKSFFNKSSVKRHMLIHTGQKPFKCEIDKRFYHKISLKNHVRIHTREPPYSVLRCAWTSDEEYDSSQEKQKRFKCDICKKLFRLRCALLSHIKHIHASQEDVSLHAEEKPFTCDICNKQFALKRYLASHIERHLLKERKKQILSQL